MGRCKSFDSTGDGYGRGEGFVAAVLQQHLPDSSLDGGRGRSGSILGLILGSAVNQAGRSSGLTAPNGPSQSALIRAALTASGMAASAVSFLSVHGTGTALGDPIEVGAMAQALPGGHGGRKAPLALASNKSCFGHTEGAAGLTGLLLAASAAAQHAAPAIMHLRGMNPYVQAALGDWEAASNRALLLPRQLAGGPTAGVAGTSSFGMSGVNAHMLVDAAPAGSGSQLANQVRARRACLGRVWFTQRPGSQANMLCPCVLPGAPGV